MPIEMVEKIGLNDDLSMYGLTSLDYINLITDIEENYCIEILDSDLNKTYLNTKKLIISIIEKYNQDSALQSKRKDAWNIMGDKFWKIGRITAKPDNEDIGSFLKDIRAGEQCLIVGASTMYLIKEAVNRNIKVTVADFSEVMINELKNELEDSCEYIIWDVLDNPPEILCRKFKYVLSDRLVNRFTYFEAIKMLENSMLLLDSGGELRYSIKLGYYKMDYNLIEYGKENNCLDEFYTRETNTFDFTKTIDFLNQCIMEHGNIDRKTLLKWYAGRGVESRFEKLDIEKLVSLSGGDLLETITYSSDSSSKIFVICEYKKCVE